jgi:transcriptional regulator with XRE-family HTH domain
MTIRQIGEIILAPRKDLRLRQEDVAEMSGVTVRTIYKIEKSKGNPLVKTLSRLCYILGLEISIAIKMID